MAWAMVPSSSQSSSPPTGTPRASMVTETSAPGSVEQRARWMDETLAAVRALRRQGIPVVGYTWFPLFSMFDWKYRRGRRPLADYALHLGLYDCAFDARGVFRRRATPLAARYRRHIAAGMPPLAPADGHGEEATE